MKRNRLTVLCILLCVSLLAGCGGEYAGMTEGDAVSGAAVSGEAVSGDAVQEKVAGSHRFCTDTNLYYAEEDQIMQAWLDGTHRKCVMDCPEVGKDRLDKVSVLYVDEEWLYYEKEICQEEQETRYGVVCRVPVEKDSEGYDRVRSSEKEEILTEINLYIVYADAHYLFYRTGDDKFMKYDLKTQKRRESPLGVDWVQEDLYVSRINGYYIAIAEQESVFVQAADSSQWTEVSGASAGVPGVQGVLQNGKSVFYQQYLTDDWEDARFCIKKCDGKKETDFVVWKQLKQTVMKAKGTNEVDMCLRWMFWQDDRLYIQIQVGWMEEEIYHMEYVILSQSEKKDGIGAGLHYEKKLTESMQSHAKTRTGKWVDVEGEEEAVILEHMTSNDAQCIAMINGVAYLSCYDYEKDRGRLACYVLDTGEFQWIDRDDAVFYKLGYDGCIQEFETVFHKQYESDREGNMYIDFYAVPSVDEMGVGCFLEDQG